jgi:hypothetical protein
MLKALQHEAVSLPPLSLLYLHLCIAPSKVGVLQLPFLLLEKTVANPPLILDLSEKVYFISSFFFSLFIFNLVLHTPSMGALPDDGIRFYLNLKA